MLYIDNLRLLFTVLVILHHVCLTYAAHSGWYFYDYLHDPFTNLILNIVMAVGRTWVLACFFLISGYFTPPSLDRKGAWPFIKDRLVRIGIPLAIFAVLIRPTIVYVMNRDTLSPQYSYLENILFFRNVAPGPAWFLEVLLVFSLGYALWRAMGRFLQARGHTQRPFPRNITILLFILLLAAFTFVIRIFLPEERQVFHLRLGNYAEYVAFFALGVAAYRHRWFDKLTDATGRQWTIITAAAVSVYVMFVIVPWRADESLSFLRGGLSAGTFAATCVGTFIAVGSSLSLIYLFRRFLNYQPGMIKAMARDAYAVFIFHAPVIVALTYATKDALPAYPFIKFLLVFLSGTALCFLICRFLIERLPFADKVL